MRTPHPDELHEALARAEKAEARVTELELRAEVLVAAKTQAEARVAELENKLRRVTGREPSQVDYILPWCTHHPKHILPSTCSDKPADSVSALPCKRCEGTGVEVFARIGEGQRPEAPASTRNAFRALLQAVANGSMPVDVALISVMREVSPSETGSEGT